MPNYYAPLLLLTKKNLKKSIICNSTQFPLIMEEKQTIVALGAGTITKRVYPDGRIERCDNVKDVALYIEKIDEMIERKRGLLS